MIKDFHMKNKMEVAMREKNDNEKVRIGKLKLTELKRGVKDQTCEVESLFFKLVGSETNSKRKLASLVSDAYVRLPFTFSLY